MSVDDGSFYFDEKLVDAREHQGPLSTTSSVVQGLTAFASVTSGSINVSENIHILLDLSI
jgi:oligosaccharyltransferase complex subunit delta (ribophorin II)